MSDRDDALPSSDRGLFLQASVAAKEQVETWIRSTLREVSLQGIRSQLLADDNSNRLTLTENSIQAIQSLCRQVADRWSRKLDEIGHKDVAAWIQHIVETESSTLFAPLKPPSRDKSAAGNAQANNDEPETPLRKPAKTPYIRLRQLGMDKPESTPQDVVDALDRLGRERFTDWPYDWNMIQKAADQIPWRLYNRATDDTEVTLIPKAVWEQQQQQQETGEQKQTEQDAKKWVLNRKRKSTTRERLPSKQQKTLIQEDIPRSAMSGDGTCQWSMAEIEKEFTERDRKQLDSYLHSPSNETTSMVLGALRDAGQFHYWNQRPIDQEDDTGKSAKKLLRNQRRAIRERLGDHREDKDDEDRRVSRLIQTVDTSGLHWYDFDLGDCLLELNDPDTGNRRFYAFGSLEVMGLDEDSCHSIPEARQSQIAHSF